MGSSGPEPARAGAIVKVNGFVTSSAIPALPGPDTGEEDAFVELP